LKEIEQMALSLKDAAKILDVHTETLRRAIKAGDLQAAKIGKDYRIAKAELERYFQSKGGGELFEDIQSKGGDMHNWFFKTNEMIRKIRSKSMEVVRNAAFSDKEERAKNNNFYDLRKDLENYYYELKEHWETKFPESDLANLKRHIFFGLSKEYGIKYGKFVDYYDIVAYDLPGIEIKAEEYIKESLKENFDL